MFSEEFKREAVELTGQHGVTISRDIGAGAGLLGRWRREMASSKRKAFPGTRS